jgi:hypothetical protein
VIRVNLVAALRLALGLEERFEDGGALVDMNSRTSLGNSARSTTSAWVTSQVEYVCGGRSLAP